MEVRVKPIAVEMDGKVCRWQPYLPCLTLYAAEAQWPPACSFTQHESLLAMKGQLMIRVQANKACVAGVLAFARGYGRGQSRKRRFKCYLQRSIFWACLNSNT